MKYLLLMILILVGCGADNPFPILDHIKLYRPGDMNQEPPFIHEEVLEYYGKFLDIYGLSPFDIPVDFRDQKLPVVGICIEYSNGDKEIQLDRKAWDSFSKAEREMLVFHELGHCLLNLGHYNEKIITDKFGDIPSSIMNSYILDTRWYKHYYDSYVEQFRGMIK